MATYTNAGMASRQAEAVVAAISRSDAELATKANLKAEIAAVKTEIAEVKIELAGVKADLKIIKYFADLARPVRTWLT